MERVLRVEGNEVVEDGTRMTEDVNIDEDRLEEEDEYIRRLDCRSEESRNYEECLLFFAEKIPF